MSPIEVCPSSCTALPKMFVRFKSLVYAIDDDQSRIRPCEMGKIVCTRANLTLPFASILLHPVRWQYKQKTHLLRLLNPSAHNDARAVKDDFMDKFMAGTS